MSARAKRFLAEEQSSGVRVKIADLGAWAATGAPKHPKKPKADGISKQSYDRAAAAVGEMMRSGDYAEAKPLHVFALFATMHAHIYGVEMVATAVERKHGCMQIANFLRAQFDGDVDALVDFVRWAWAKERSLEQWRRDNPGRCGNGLQVCWTFTAKKLNAYRVDMARAHTAR